MFETERQIISLFVFQAFFPFFSVAGALRSHCLHNMFFSASETHWIWLRSFAGHVHEIFKDHHFDFMGHGLPALSRWMLKRWKLMKRTC